MEALHLIVQERHLALEMSFSERLTPKGREKKHLQTNNKPEPKQLKLKKTHPSMWS
jgi:hypothetical protein